jgi:hypothetical protein
MASSKEEEKTGQIETLVQLTGLSRLDFGVLTTLNLPNCGLSSLPSCLPEILPNLSILFMPKNKFEELPSVIGSCPNLQVGYDEHAKCSTMQNIEKRAHIIDSLFIYFVLF